MCSPLWAEALAFWSPNTTLPEASDLRQVLCKGPDLSVKHFDVFPGGSCSLWASCHPTASVPDTRSRMEGLPDPETARPFVLKGTEGLSGAWLRGHLAACPLGVLLWCQSVHPPPDCTPGCPLCLTVTAMLWTSSSGTVLGTAVTALTRTQPVQETRHPVHVPPPWVRNE